VELKCLCGKITAINLPPGPTPSYTCPSCIPEPKDSIQEKRSYSRKISWETKNHYQDIKTIPAEISLDSSVIVGMLEKIPYEEKQVLGLFFGIGQERRTLKDIAKLLGKTEDQVWWLKKKGIKKLKSLARIKDGK
jgi:DNA-directed RNA polymerase specialized sigma subunit